MSILHNISQEDERVHYSVLMLPSRLPVGRSQTDPVSRFDVYGDLSPDLERERLDAVAAELRICSYQMTA